MTEDVNNNLGFDTHLIDVNLYRPRLAACYLIRKSNELALIDCGTQHSIDQILYTIEMIGASLEQVRWVIPTHVHLDHASGAGRLMQICPNATIICHPKGFSHLVNPERLQNSAVRVYGENNFKKNFGTLMPINERKVIAAKNNQIFNLGGSDLVFIDTPGHANHHGSIFDPESGFLFTGDSFGLGYREFFENSSMGVPFIMASTSPIGFDPEAWNSSINRMLSYDPTAICLTHFGKYSNPKKLAIVLKESIQKHTEIALKEEGKDAVGRRDRIFDHLKHDLIERAIRSHSLSPEKIYQLLEMDINLNAQGLEIWLQRRAKYIKN